ncbi:hypothetical protein E2C01_066306 [Portunus trituberculatus]|uniref:Uncharacterized protein n=1 Tax=Portunus trituberculatus TaxID=210409 RepID=A0A5B7HUB4_PORTR|nr:hypothetical protein [Portunus trituberculatus]
MNIETRHGTQGVKLTRPAHCHVLTRRTPQRGGLNRSLFSPYLFCPSSRQPLPSTRLTRLARYPHTLRLFSLTYARFTIRHPQLALPSHLSLFARHRKAHSFIIPVAVRLLMRRPDTDQLPSVF